MLLMLFPFRKQRALFSCSFRDIIDIKALIFFPGLMANRQDDDHPINDKVEEPVFTKAEFQQFREEN